MKESVMKEAEAKLMEVKEMLSKEGINPMEFMHEHMAGGEEEGEMEEGPKGPNPKLALIISTMKRKRNA